MISVKKEVYLDRVMDPWQWSRRLRHASQREFGPPLSVPVMREAVLEATWPDLFSAILRA